MLKMNSHHHAAINRTETSNSHYNFDDPRNRCCCNIHVQHGALIVGGVGIALSLAGIAGFILWGRYVNLVAMVVSIALYASIVYAQYTQSAQVYWPYMIVNVS